MDETQPLLPQTIPTGIPERDENTDKNLVAFDPEGDVDNPVDWPAAYKWSIVALLAFTAFTVTFTCIGVVPIANRIVSDLNGGQSSKSASVLLVTIWELGEAAGPLLIAPLSEIYGRYPVMIVCNVGFIAATILAALCRSTPLFIAARALTGLAVASNVLNPAIVGDMFISEQRGSGMSIIALAPLTGGAVGPLISMAVAEALGWRAVLWICAIVAGVCQLMFLTFFRETYKVPILRRKAARLRAETGNASLKSAYDYNAQGVSKLRESVLRPALVLFGSGVLQMLSLFGSVIFTWFYMMSTTLAVILEEVYGLAPAETGAAYISFSVGAFISVLLCNTFLDRIYVTLRDANNGVGQPEFRLPLVIIGSLTLPLSTTMYGWAAELRLPVPALLLSIVLLGVTLMLAFLPLMAYVVDAFGVYSASALTALIVTRCLMSTFLPMATPPLIDNYGWGWGLTILSGITLLLAPLPMVIFRYGHKWRQWSKYTKEE